MAAPPAAPGQDKRRATVALAPDALGTLKAPVAVRVLDVDAPLGDLDLSYQYVRHDYRSLLAVVRLAEDPIGVATFPVDPGGYVTRAQLAGGLHRQLGAELDEAYARRVREPKPDSGWDTSELAPVTEVPPCPSVSVVLPTRGNLEMLERSLRSILLCDYDDLEVIVVETKPRSSDTARMLVRQFPGERRVRYVEEPRANASRARNVAVARAEGEIVAFADEDMVVDRLWLRASVEALLSEQGVACVTGLILPLDLDSTRQVLLEQSAGFRKGFRRRTYRLPDAWAENPLLSYAAGALGSGASIVMRTELARELGGFDPALGPATPATAGEDIDLLVRLLQSGSALSYEPRAIVWRERPGGAGGLRRQAYRHGVGLGAMLGKQLMARPKRRDFLRAIPAGVCYLRAPGSREEMPPRTRIPRHLAWLERLGMLIGPIAYLVGALMVRARRRAEGSRAPIPRPLRIVRRMVVAGERVNVVWFRDAEAPRRRFVWQPAAEHTRPSLLGWARRQAQAQRHRIAAAVAVLAPLVILTAYYRKEDTNHFTPQEAAAARYLDTHAPPRSLLVDATNDYPFSFKNHKRFFFVPIAEEPSASRDRVLADPATALSSWANGRAYRAVYVILTRSQKVEAESDGVLPRWSVDVIQNALLASPRFRVVFRNRDATVFSALIYHAGSGLAATRASRSFRLTTRGLHSAS